MSGGSWNYESDNLCSRLYGYGIHADYGEGGRRQSAFARVLDPLQDGEISEMCFDMLCLLHSFDWYQCADTDEEQYRADVQAFKEKWLKCTPTKRAVRECNATIQIIRKEVDAKLEDLCKSLGVPYPASEEEK